MAIPNTYPNTHLMIRDISILEIRNVLDQKKFCYDIVFEDYRILERAIELGFNVEQWNTNNSPYKVVYYDGETNAFIDA